MLFQVHQLTRNGIIKQHKPLHADESASLSNDPRHSVIPLVHIGHFQALTPSTE
jgi:hypothetical protein